MAIQAHLSSDNLGFPLLRVSHPQAWMDNSACGAEFNDFSFNLQNHHQKRPHQQLQFPLHKNENNLCVDYYSTALPPTGNNINNQSMASSWSLEERIDKQSLDLDRFISLQNERLRLAVQEQRKQQIVLLLNKYETRSQFFLRQKDEEIAIAGNRTMELEELLRRMEMENQTWKRVAKESEAMVMSLNNTIEQLRGGASCLPANGIEDADSCCDVIMEDNDRGDDQTLRNKNNNNNNKVGEQQQQPEQENGEERRRKMICKSCNYRNSSFILLPCRHLCSCKACESFLDSCPVCRTVKKASIEALV